MNRFLLIACIACASACPASAPVMLAGSADGVASAQPVVHVPVQSIRIVALRGTARAAASGGAK